MAIEPADRRSILPLAAREPQPLLQVRSVCRRFGGVIAVDAVTFTLVPGELVALVGPNGAGKSTLLQLINGVLRPDSGRILLANVDITGLPPDRIARYGVARTFQTSRVFPHLTVWDSVRVGLATSLPTTGAGTAPGVLAQLLSALFTPPSYRRQQQEIDRQAEAVLRLFGDRLWPRRFDLAQSLSYANRRRLELARALASQPRLLLLDEPAAGMNPTETAELAHLIARLRQERPTLSILLVEHKMNFVRSLADRVLVLNQGRLIAAGRPEEVLNQPEVIAAYLGRHTGPTPIAKSSLTPQPTIPAHIGEGGSHARPLITTPAASAPAASATSAAAITTPTPAAEPEPLLRVESIDVYYGSLQVLFGVSFVVRPGETVVLLGGNASGKSTTLKTVLGLLHPRRGAIYLAGRQVDHADTAQIIAMGVGSVPEGRRVFPEMTVEENLLMGAFSRYHLGHRDDPNSHDPHAADLSTVSPAAADPCMTAGPTIDWHTTDHSAANRPAAGHLDASHPVTDRPAAGHPAADRPVTGRPVTGHPVTGRRIPALREDLEAALALFPDLAVHLHQPAGTLSGGEQQLLALARALMRQPRLLCIDEPSMGLSPLYADRVYDRIRSLQTQGITILMVEQNADRALAVADRAYVLASGQIVLSGPARELAADPHVRQAYLGEEAPGPCPDPRTSPKPVPRASPGLGLCACSGSGLRASSGPGLAAPLASTSTPPVRSELTRG
ncbi:MAG: ATP-binding cassette domain-containing protein [Limnochordaceae bacterium]|nr:ATP-binding cassette domain-containing protein [Limnochordaceae bacterium]